MNRKLRALIFLCLIPSQAHAYLDPGAGSLLMQSLIAAGMSAFLFLRKPLTIIKNILQSVRRLIGKK